MGEKLKSLASRLEAVLAENDTCADCPTKRPLWASYLRWPKKGMADESRMDESSRQHGDEEIDVDIDGALGVIVCNDCAQHHHFELGKKRCLIKYLKYSHELTARDLDILEQSGNQLVNEYYEANLWGHFQKELVLGDNEAEGKRRGKFIKEKYKKCLYRDHAGIAKAVEQCLKLQTYQNDMGGIVSGGGGGASSSKSSGGSRRSSTATTTSRGGRGSGDDNNNNSDNKHDEKIGNAMRELKRTKSGESDYKRTKAKDNNRRSSTAVVSPSSPIPKLPMNPNDPFRQKRNNNKKPGMVVPGMVFADDDDDDSDREEIPKYNPTGKTYTEEFNLETAKEKEEEKASLLKEFIEKGPDPNDDEFSIALEGDDDNDEGEETDDDDDNSHAGWGIHCLKSQLQVVKNLSKNEVRTLTLTKDRNNLMNPNPVDPRRKSSRASTLGMHMKDLNDSKQQSLRNKAGVKRTSSLDDSFSSLQLPPQKEIHSLDNLQAKMNQVQSALEKTIGVAESLKKHSTAAASMMEDASVQSMRVTSSTSTTKEGGGGRSSGGGSRGAPPQRGVLRRNSSLSDLDKLKESAVGESSKSTKSSTKRGGRKKSTIPVEAKRKKRMEEKAAADEASNEGGSNPTKPTPARGRSGSVSPGRRRMMRRGSSMSNIDDADADESSDFIKELKKKKIASSNDDNSSNNNKTNKSTMDESSVKKDRSRSGSVASRRGTRRRSVATSEMRDDGSGLSVSGEGGGGGRKGKRLGGGTTTGSLSPKQPDSRRRTSTMSDMSGSGGSSGGPLSDKLSKLKGVTKTRGRTSVVSAPVMSDHSAPAIMAGRNAGKRDRSRTRNQRFDRSRSSSIESGPVPPPERSRRTNSADSTDSRRSRTGSDVPPTSRSRRRTQKRSSVTDMADLPDLKQSPKSETDAASVATMPATLTTGTGKGQEAEASKPPKSNKNRSKSPKKDSSAVGLNVGEKLASLPDMKPKTRKDAKSVRSMPARSRSSSAEGNPRLPRNRSRSPKRKPTKDMHKSMTGVNLAQKVVDDLNEKAAGDTATSAPFNRAKTVNVMEQMDDETTKKIERDAAAAPPYNRAKTDSGVRLTQASNSNGRSKSPGRRGLHKSLSGLDDKNLDVDSDLKSSNGLGETNLKKRDSDDRSVATAPVASEGIKRKESGSSLPPKKASYRMSQGYLDPAKLGGLQEEPSMDTSIASTNSMPLEDKMPKKGGRRSKSPKKTSFHLSHGVIDAAKLGGLEDLRKEFGKDEQSTEMSVASTSTKSKDAGAKGPKTRARSPKKASLHMSHGVLDSAKLGGLQDLRKEFGKDEQSTEMSVVSTTTKSKDGRPPKHKGRTKSPKKDPAKKNNNANCIDSEMLSNLSDTISEVRKLVGPPAEKDMDGSAKSTGGVTRKGRMRSSVASVTPIPESSEPDKEKLNIEMAEKMKQFKLRNERVDNTVRSSGRRTDRRRSSSLTGAFTEMAKSGDSEIKGMIGKTLIQGKKSTDKPKRNKSGEKKTRKMRRMSRSLNDMHKVADDPEKEKERRFLRNHMNAMLDDNSGNEW